jgi:hypothetical protein
MRIIRWFYTLICSIRTLTILMEKELTDRAERIHDRILQLRDSL